MVKLPTRRVPLARRDAGLVDVTRAYNQTNRQRKFGSKVLPAGRCVVAVMHRLEALRILEAKLGSVEESHHTELPENEDLRASELRGLRWSDLNLKRGTLHVQQRADRFYEIGRPKSEDSEREVPFGRFVANTLKEWKLACPKGELDLVFPTSKGKVADHANIIRDGLIPAQIAAGVVTKEGKAKYTGLHALRHFYASWCINRTKDGGLGLPPKNVQERLGHSSITITLDTYGHLFKGDDAQEIDAAEQALLGAT